MKRIKNWIFALAAIVMLSATIEVKAQPGVSVSFNVFYDNLSPYGDWIQDPSYGYVWVPNVGSGFRPYYTNGYWVMTDYGNTWVSNYAWGWAPFHYGRWTYDAYYGWLWIPDTSWGPAWVSWRSSGSYYGWAPLGPGYGYNYASYYPPNDWWVFIPPRYIHDHNFHNYYNGPRNNTTIINNTTVINNIYENNGNKYISGPRRNDIERSTQKQVPVYNVRNQSKPGQVVTRNNEVNIYRPQITGNAKQTAPRNVVTAKTPISRPAAVGINNGTPQRIQPTTPAQRTTPTAKPSRDIQQRNAAPVQRTSPAPQSRPQPSNTPVQRTAPAQPRNDIQPRNTAPVQRTAPAPQSRPQPSNTPVQRTAPAQPRNDIQPRNTAPVQRTAPAPQSRPQPSSQPVQRAAPQPRNDMPQSQPQQPRQIEQPRMQQSSPAPQQRMQSSPPQQMQPQQRMPQQNRGTNDRPGASPR